MNIPKFYLYLFFTAFCSKNLIAQGKFSLGIDAGVRNEKAKFDDPKEYIFRNLYPSGTIGLAGTYEYSDRWEFEIGVYRTTFNSNVSAFYNEPGYTPFTKYGDQGGGGFASLQIPVRGIYFSGIKYRKFSLNILGGITIFHQFDTRKFSKYIGPGTVVFPQPAPVVRMEFIDQIVNRTSIAFEIGPEIRYDISERFYLAYRFSGNLGTRDKVSIEGSYFTSDNPQTIHDFEVVQRGTSINHFLSIRYRLGRKTKNNTDFDYYGY
ncbi:hypothetical protein MM236_00285 [Belliella sp. DSM 107340]|uniref:Outer membrane protein beta-barrel domain-containing protein n=1 Tax=Belliella calami TaxID=2923436 RepID=A0ABS9UJJ2_9BACT|nr:hypothetical protein [Belliella calami]MCH7396398.1 hypothetical protein [Belliella calami]